MIALFALLVLVSGAGLVAAWFGGHPGAVTMMWMGYRIDTSVGVLILAILITALIAANLYHFFRRLLTAPGRISERRSLKQYRLGLSEVTHSIAALAASDIDSAVRHTKKAEKALGKVPVTLLLRAQISKSRGNDEETRGLLNQLLEHKETEYLAAKSLADVAHKQHLLPQALTLAERAHRSHPKETQGAWAVFNLHLEAGHFEEAEAHARQARKTGAFSRADALTAEGKIALKQALVLDQKGQKDHALTLAAKAARLIKGDAEAALLAAKLYMEMQRPKESFAIIQQQWEIAPSAELVELFRALTEDKPPAKKKRLAAKLSAVNSDYQLD